MIEIYKPIPEYEDLYEISNYGAVRSLDRYNIDKHGKKKFYPGRQLSLELLAKDHTSYNRVTLSKNGTVKRYSVHRLVALTFIPTHDPSLHINHIDNNGLNNKVDNLEWVTHSQNMLHAQKQQRLFHAQSKGGKTLGHALEEKIQERIDTLKNSKVHNWTVLEYIGYTSIGARKCYAFNCQCKCGHEQLIDSTRLESRSVTMCIKCAKKENTLKSIHELLALSDKFTGNYKLNDEALPNKSKCTYEIFEDGTTKYISYHLAKKLVS
jgi:hypothetical protein